MDFFEIKFDEDFVSGVIVKHRYTVQGRCQHSDGTFGPIPFGGSSCNNTVVVDSPNVVNKTLEIKALDKATLTKKGIATDKLKK